MKKRGGASGGTSVCRRFLGHGAQGSDPCGLGTDMNSHTIQD